MAQEKGLAFEVQREWAEDLHASRADMVAQCASTANGFLEAATDNTALQKLPYSFSIDLEKQGHMTNQKASGRCWLFAALNVFRYEMIAKYNLEDFELSQNYLFFYDKLERSNYYLETMITLADEPLTSRLLCFLNRDPMGDGGQWDMMANIVRKYGVVPKAAYPDSANSVKSIGFNPYLASLLREDAAALRKAHRNGAPEETLRAMKKEQMQDVYRFLCIALGEPPKTFDHVMRDKDGKVYQDFGIDGRTFYDKYIGLDLDRYISLINAPTDDKPMGRTYTIEHLGNVVEGEPIRYLNLPMESIKAAVIAQLKDGHPVWFGSDCRWFRLRDQAVWDRASLNVEQLTDIRFRFTKGERLQYGDSAMNHAMVFLGVNLDEEGRSDRWRIENSWGKDIGPNDGYFIASDAWFDEFVYQAVVDRAYLDEETRKLAAQDMIPLKPWDPMGTLA